MAPSLLYAVAMPWTPAAASQIRIWYFWKALMVGGGVPIKAGDEIAGAIGVSGSPGSVHDEECAETRITRIAASLN